MAKVGEEWRPVVNYEGLYEVSNYGRVRSLPRNTTLLETENSERWNCLGIFDRIGRS